MGRKPIPEKDKKSPADYPQFSFRVSREKKAELLLTIESIQNSMNRKKLEGESYINKNDVIIQALEVGLKTIKKKN